MYTYTRLCPTNREHKNILSLNVHMYMYTYICKFFSFDIALQGRSDQCLQRCEWFVHLYESDGRRPGDPRHQGNQNSDREVLQH